MSDEKSVLVDKSVSDEKSVSDDYSVSNEKLVRQNMLLGANIFFLKLTLFANLSVHTVCTYCILGTNNR